MDNVNHPAHYASGGIECIDYIDACGYGLGFCLGNVIKYITRCERKENTIQDLKKAEWYLHHAIEILEKEVRK